ncbi:MAG TPA: hypothetical protein VFQ85_04175 [Mycobacteriales bacterium]|nr:hypothetical protein [Mycobacteriales bacterium]
MRLAVFGAGAASVPFLIVELFVWARTGGYVGVPALLGGGDLLPSVALLAGQGLADAYALPRRARAHPRWPGLVGACWFLLAATCVTFVVPYSGGAGSAPRVAVASLVLLGLVATASALVLVLDL